MSRQFRERAERQEAERRAFVEAEMRKNTARARALKQETRGYPSGGRYLPIQRP